jgi:hypothetical protein
MTKQFKPKKCPKCGQLFAFENCHKCKENDVKCWCKKCFINDTFKKCGKDLEINKVFIFR